MTKFEQDVINNIGTLLERTEGLPALHTQVTTIQTRQDTCPALEAAGHANRHMTLQTLIAATSAVIAAIAVGVCTYDVLTKRPVEGMRLHEPSTQQEYRAPPKG